MSARLVLLAVFIVRTGPSNADPAPVNNNVADFVDGLRSSHPVLVIFDRWKDLEEGLLRELHSRSKSAVLWKVRSRESVRELPSLFRLYYFRAVVCSCSFSRALDSVAAVQEEDGYFHNRTWLLLQGPDNSSSSGRMCRSRYRERMLLASESRLLSVQADDRAIHLTAPEEGTNLRGKELTVTTLNSHPTTALRSDGDGKLRGYGLVFDILDMASERLNFSYRVTVAEDGLYGGPSRNGSWNGVLGHLVRGEADLTGTLLQASPERSKVVDFSVGLFVDEMRLMQRMPTDERNTDALLAPFTSRVWLAIAASFILASLFVYAILSAERVAAGRPRPTVAGVAWHLYATLLNQGDACDARASASRVALATYGVFSLLLTTYYTALLTSFMFAPTYVIRVRQISDFAEHAEVPFVVKNGSAFYNEVWHDQGLRVLRDGLSSGRGLTVTSDRVASALVRDAGYVYIQRAFVIDLLIREDVRSTSKCDFYNGEASIWETAVALAYRKNSPYREIFDEQLSLLRSHGHLVRLMSRYYAPRDICPLPSYSSVRALTVSDHATTWKVLVFGITASLLSHFALITIAARKRRGHRPAPRSYWFSA